MLGCSGLNIVRSTVQNWHALEDIVSVFKAKGFVEIEKEPDGFLISLMDEASTFLKIIEAGSDYSHCFKALDTNVQYLLLSKECKEFLFVKDEFSATGRQKRVKFKFSKDKLEKSTLVKLNALEYNNIRSFDNLFDTKAVVKEFYRQYKEKLDKLARSIKNIRDDKDKAHYAQILFDRLIFLYFIQTKKFLSDDRYYLANELVKAINKNKSYYDDFLKFLFFEVLNKKKSERTSLRHSEFQDVPFLNGGLFREHRIELENPRIWISNEIFGEIISFLDGWIWYVDESADFGEDKSLNPEILGHIFEKTITNQKEKGAYYTPSNVTNYIAQNTVLRFCIDRINEEYGTKYANIKQVFENPDHSKFLYFSVLRGLSILDNACGSGAFLLAAEKMLFDLYSRAWSVIKDTKGAEVEHEKRTISKFLSDYYYFKRHIITSNIYGADLEEGAIEICKLRLWLSLISEIEKENAEPLPNIDYNIIYGNSLIGYTSASEEKQMSLSDNVRMKTLLDEIDEMKRRFREETDPKEVSNLKKQIDEKTEQYDLVLNRKLAADYSTPVKEIEKLKPLNWRLKFNNVFSEKSGFDIIIGNPPYFNIKPGSELKNLDHYKELSDGVVNVAAIFVKHSMKLLNKNGYLGFIIPKSFAYVDSWKPLRDFVYQRTQLLKVVDVSKAFEDVLLEQVILVVGNQYPNRKLQVGVVSDFDAGSYHEKPVEYGVIISGDRITFSSNAIEVVIHDKMCKDAIFLGNISENFRGIGAQSFVTHDTSNSERLVSGKDVQRYSLAEYNNYFVKKKDVVSFGNKVSRLREPKIMAQNIVAHIKNHIKIIATYDDEGLLNLDTVNNIVVKDKHFLPKYILALLNSKLIGYYTYNFIYSKAIRTMHFDANYSGRIPVKPITIPEQQKLVSLVDKVLNLNKRLSSARKGQKEEAAKVKDDIEALVKSIDQHIFQIYGLGQKETEEVEKSYR